jgi:uncharacterized protein (TIRG00374 family)
MKKFFLDVWCFYKKYRKIINTALRIILSLGLIIYLFMTQFKDINAISITLKEIVIKFALLSFSTIIYGVWITAYRWQTLLKTQNIKLSIISLSSSMLIGSFFNNLLPTSIGGDIYRAYDITQKSGFPMSSSVSVLVVERLSGILASGIFACASLFLGFTAIGGKSIVIPIIIFMFISIILFLLILNLNKLGLKKLVNKLKFLRNPAEKLQNIYNTFLNFKLYKWVLIKVLFYSLTLQFAVVLNYWLAAKSLGIGLSMTAFIFIVPIVTIISMLPISLGGTGVREGSLVFLLVSLNISHPKAAMCSLLLLAMTLIVGIIGGLIFAVRPFLNKKKQTI